jgi:hypothetical protein
LQRVLAGEFSLPCVALSAELRFVSGAVCRIGGTRGQRSCLKGQARFHALLMASVLAGTFCVSDGLARDHGPSGLPGRAPSGGGGREGNTITFSRFGCKNRGADELQGSVDMQVFILSAASTFPGPSTVWSSGWLVPRRMQMKHQGPAPDEAPSSTGGQRQMRRRVTRVNGRRVARVLLLARAASLSRHGEGAPCKPLVTLHRACTLVGNSAMGSPLSHLVSLAVVVFHPCRSLSPRWKCWPEVA